ncbi:hypothetical protein V8F20_009255 [Naviculisporaceae sp. PSN 640]
MPPPPIVPVASGFPPELAGPGPVLFTDRALPPVIPKTSAAPVATPTSIPHIRGRDSVIPIGLANSELEQLTSEPTPLSVVPTSTHPRDSDTVWDPTSTLPRGPLLKLRYPPEIQERLEALAREGEEVDLTFGLVKGDPEGEANVAVRVEWWGGRGGHYTLSLSDDLPEDEKQILIDVLKQLSVRERAGRFSPLKDHGYSPLLWEPLDGGKNGVSIIFTSPDASGEGDQENAEGQTLKKRATLDDSKPAASEADSAIPDNQSPLRPVGTEYDAAHGNSNQRKKPLDEQPKVRFGEPKNSATDKYGNPPGWPISRTISFDEHVLGKDEPYAPAKPSLRGQDVPTGNVPDNTNNYHGAAKKIKRGEDQLIVPEFDNDDLVSLIRELMTNFEGYEDTPSGREALDQLEQYIPIYVPDPKITEEQEALRLLLFIDYLQKSLDNAKAEKAAGVVYQEKESDGKAVERRQTPPSEDPTRFSDPRLEQESSWRKTHKGDVRQHEQPVEFDFNLRSRLDNDYDWKKKLKPRQPQPQPQYTHTPHRFNDPRLEEEAGRRRKGKGGDLRGSRFQEEQPLEYNFDVNARLDNEEREIWPFNDGFDDVLHHDRNRNPLGGVLDVGSSLIKPGGGAPCVVM